MFELSKNAIFFANIILLMQVIFIGAQGGGLGDATRNPSTSEPEVLNPEKIIQHSQTTAEVPELTATEKLLQATTSQITPHDLKANEDAFQTLQLFYGPLGPLLFDVITNQNALGVEFSKVSKIIITTLDLEQYRHGLGIIFELANRTDFSNKLTPLFEKIADIPDPKNSGETFGHAVEIIKNILQNEDAINQIRERITSPDTQLPQVLST